MMNFEEFENLINDIKTSLDDTTSALLSEKLLNVVSNYKIGVDKIEEMTKDLEKIKNEKDELLKVNGKLFQQIGFDNRVSERKRPTVQGLRRQRKNQIYQRHNGHSDRRSDRDNA